jgi:hypothetical protein
MRSSRDHGHDPGPPPSILRSFKRGAGAGVEAHYLLPSGEEVRRPFLRAELPAETLAPEPPTPQPPGAGQRVA